MCDALTLDKLKIFYTNIDSIDFRYTGNVGKTQRLFQKNIRMQSNTLQCFFKDSLSNILDDHFCFMMNPKKSRCARTKNENCINLSISENLIQNFG